MSVDLKILSIVILYKTKMEIICVLWKKNKEKLQFFNTIPYWEISL